jgi:hypothetical protein
MGCTDTGERESAWRKSRRSIGNGECVEVASAQDVIMVRDSADPSGPVIQYPTHVWQGFLTVTKTGKMEGAY